MNYLDVMYQGLHTENKYQDLLVSILQILGVN